MKRDRIELTEGEWAIIRAVWENEPCAAPTVQEVLEDEKGWSYSTVKTLMDRMKSKGLLRSERLRNLVLYRSAVSRTEARRSEISRMSRRAFGGSLAPMMQFLVGDGELSEADLAELESMIRRERKQRGGASRRKAKP